MCFPGIFYRGGAEQKIRKYLIDNNFVETVISLAPNLFFGTTIAVNILVLAKNKTDNKTQFIDASDFFKKETNNNILTDSDKEGVEAPGHIQQILNIFDKKEEIEHIAKLVDYEKIVENDYNLSVSSYVEAKDTREKVDITELNEAIKVTVEKIDKLRTDIDKIIEVIEG